jgi:hypothetical protein
MPKQNIQQHALKRKPIGRRHFFVLKNAFDETMMLPNAHHLGIQFGEQVFVAKKFVIVRDKRFVRHAEIACQRRKVP